MVRVGNAHHSLVIYISKKLKFYYYEKTYFYVVVYLDGNRFCASSKGVSENWRRPSDCRKQSCSLGMGRQKEAQ